MFCQLVLLLCNLESLNFSTTFQDRIPVPVPERTEEDVLLFFKLYHPEKEELRYVAIVGVPGVGDVNMIIKKFSCQHDSY